VTGRIGIFYLLGEKLLIDSSPIARTGEFSDLEFHSLAHEVWWAQLVTKSVAPNTFYAEFPRGRVSYNRRSREFTFRADSCILRQESLVRAIMKWLHLTAGQTKIFTDCGYRCGECAGRE
jgi:hypothetical protein